MCSCVNSFTLMLSGFDHLILFIPHPRKNVQDVVNPCSQPYPTSQPHTPASQPVSQPPDHPANHTPPSLPSKHTATSSPTHTLQRASQSVNHPHPPSSKWGLRFSPNPCLAPGNLFTHLVFLLRVHFTLILSVFGTFLSVFPSHKNLWDFAKYSTH